MSCTYLAPDVSGLACGKKSVKDLISNDSLLSSVEAIVSNGLTKYIRFYKELILSIERAKLI
jgi:hypothetical protein